ncbi:glycosyltransferase family 2 protein [Nocardioides sp. Kera G14]|uniref:glycosyltransferase family 2 protein n=1 Tax=Nocardioides sp. Kera G14 TaxID=2884264 RepID=UPI001D116A9F|nr:glycosyltransferase family 2 protein [Nocardioides sp. Kera G14]UDY24549.1 glycosyltransferase family 2 protein [Nocardioides sp. Kera G14]
MRLFGRSAKPGQEAETTEPAAYEPRGGSARIAALTMARDEGAMLRRWVEHHAGLVGLEAVVVLDDHSVDGSTDGLGCTVHHLPDLDGLPFERTRMTLVSKFAEALLVVHDYVVFLDADEFLALGPDYPTLSALLATRGWPAALGPLGLNVVHLPGEPPLDLDQPLLAQRAGAVFTPLMCKPVLKRTEAAWARASHALRAPYAVDPGLFLLHLKFADRDRLATMAARRHDAFRTQGRARGSSWESEADDIVAALDRAVAGVNAAELPALAPETLDLDALVTEQDGVWRPPREGQLQALARGPVVAIPTLGSSL